MLSNFFLRLVPKGLFAFSRVVDDMQDGQKNCRFADLTESCGVVRDACVEDYGSFPRAVTWAKRRLAFRDRFFCVFKSADVFVQSGNVLVGKWMVSGCGSGIRGTILASLSSRVFRILCKILGRYEILPERQDGYAFVKANGYFHFIMESLVQLLMTLKACPNATVLVAQNTYGGFVKDYIEMLKANGVIKELRLVRGEVLKVPHYAVVNLESESSQVCSSSIGLLRTSLGCPVDVLPSKKVFITRREKRSFSNQDQVERLMESLGFEIVDTTPMSIADEIKFFSTVSFVVANHGAGLTNVVYMPTGGKVVEIFSPVWLHDVYFRLAKACGHRYNMYVADTSNDGSPWGTVDCDKLRNVLDGFMEEGGNRK